MGLYGPVALPAQSAAGGTSTTEVGTVQVEDGNGLGVTAITFTPPAGYSTVTGVATNNATFNVRQVRAGTSLGVIGTVTLASGTNLTAEIPLQVTPSQSSVLAAGDVFDVQMVQNGTGIAIGAGVLVEIAVN